MSAYDKYLVANLIAGDAQIVANVPITIYAIELISGVDIAQLEITNDDDGSGANIIHLKNGVIQSSIFRDYTRLGGVGFNTEAYFDFSGTTPFATVWYSRED